MDEMRLMLDELMGQDRDGDREMWGPPPFPAAQHKLNFRFLVLINFYRAQCPKECHRQGRL